MFSPAKAITVGALVIGGAFLIAQPFQRESSVPGAAALPPPTGPADNGLLAFAADGDIWVMDPDGGDRRRLTTGPAEDRAPVWSPDGTRLAYWSQDDVGRSSRLIVTAADGSSPVTVLQDDAGRTSVSLDWSPDGSSVAFALCREEEACGELVLAATDGSGSDTIGDPSIKTEVLAWSPDGSALAFGAIRDGDVRGIYLVDPDGSDIRRIEPGSAARSLPISRASTGRPTGAVSPPTAAPRTPMSGSSTWTARASRCSCPGASCPSGRPTVRGSPTRKRRATRWPSSRQTAAKPDRWARAPHTTWNGHRTAPPCWSLAPEDHDRSTSRTVRFAPSSRASLTSHPGNAKRHKRVVPVNGPGHRTGGNAGRKPHSRRTSAPRRRGRERGRASASWPALRRTRLSSPQPLVDGCLSLSWCQRANAVPRRVMSWRPSA